MGKLIYLERHIFLAVRNSDFYLKKMKNCGRFEWVCVPIKLLFFSDNLEIIYQRGKAREGWQENQLWKFETQSVQQGEKKTQKERNRVYFIAVINYN